MIAKHAERKHRETGTLMMDAMKLASRGRYKLSVITSPFHLQQEKYNKSHRHLLLCKLRPRRKVSTCSMSLQIYTSSLGLVV